MPNPFELRFRAGCDNCGDRMSAGDECFRALIPIRDAAKLLGQGVTPAMLVTARRAGKLRCVKLGKRWFTDATAIEEFREGLWQSSSCSGRTQGTGRPHAKGSSATSGTSDGRADSVRRASDTIKRLTQSKPSRGSSSITAGEKSSGHVVQMRSE